MRDSCNRTISYLRLSLTEACNLRCDYCMPGNALHTITQSGALSNDDLFAIVEVLVELGITKIRLTGGEPLLYPSLLSCIEKLSSYSQVEELALTTNGLLLAKMAKSLKTAGIGGINVSLDTLDAEKYRRLTRGGRLADVRDGIAAAKKAGLGPIKLNTVLMRGVNDEEIRSLHSFADEHGCDIRFIEMMPIGCGRSFFDERFMSVDRVLPLFPEIRQAKSECASAARYYELPGSRVRIGLISSISDHFCSSCNRIRLNSRGELRACLLDNSFADLSTSLGDTQRLRERVRWLVSQKQAEHSLDSCQETPMYQIGG